MPFTVTGALAHTVLPRPIAKSYSPRKSLSSGEIWDHHLIALERLCFHLYNFRIKSRPKYTWCEIT